MDYIITLRVTNYNANALDTRELESIVCDAADRARAAANDQFENSPLSVVDWAQVTDESGDDIRR